MNKASAGSRIWTVVILLLAVSFIIAGRLSRRVQEEGFEGKDIKCIIELGRYDDTTKGLISGYNYALLQKFAGDIRSEVDIRNGRNGGSWVDSLKAGAIDILVVPLDTLVVSDSIMSSIPIDSLTKWLIGGDNYTKLEEVNDWIQSYHHSEEYQSFRDQFLKTYNPIRMATAGMKRSVLSPYDDLFRQYADTLGWDWRLLAAIVYQESRFRINAHSYKGAEGLMQLIPSTARRFGVENSFDPEQSIRGAVMYMRRLQNIFWRYPSTARDRRIFTMAAYNAGEGSIKKCIKYADSLGVSVTSWEELETFMPMMEFKWAETVMYLSRIDSCYQAFCTICQK